MKSPRAYSAEKNDHTIVLLVIGMVFLFAFSAWVAKESNQLILWWKTFYLPQAKLVAWFSSTLLGEIFNECIGQTKDQAQSLVAYLQNTDVSQITKDFCWLASQFTGKYFAGLFLPIGVYLTVKCWRETQGCSDIYRRFKNAEVLSQFVRKNTGEVAIKDFYPEKLSASYSLQEFAKANNLFNATGKAKLSLKLKETTQYFLAQLGKKFTAMENLINEPYGWVAVKLLAAIPSHHKQTVISEIQQTHHYDFTALVGLLIQARKYHVTSSALFLPVKENFPGLWYALNNAGRKRIFIEGAAISYQYAKETWSKQHQKKLKSTHMRFLAKTFQSALQHEIN